MATYVKKPAPSHLSEKQKKEWDYGEEQRYQSSLKQDARTMKDIAPQVDTGMTAPKDASKAAEAGTAREEANRKAVSETVPSAEELLKRSRKGEGQKYYK